MSRRLVASAARRTFGLLLAALVAAAAQADDGMTASTRVPLLPAYRQECAACHLAYPPALRAGSA